VHSILAFRRYSPALAIGVPTYAMFSCDSSASISTRQIILFLLVGRTLKELDCNFRFLARGRYDAPLFALAVLQKAISI
jgi:hypothetical protein